ncbi:MAG: alpha-amylase family glycosyl hydrolase, partial [Thermoanaerobaculia bacterium]|nr:alpha-amylase family glycosyl hydrolase [Thermoanaerobaculia bacterium]
MIRVSRAGISILAAIIFLAGCTTGSRVGSTPAPPSQPVASQSVPVAIPPLPDWRDAVIYFVVLDRFADGDEANNVKVDVSAKGAFHGGDLKGLIGRLDDLRDLGVNAIWVTPVVKNIDGFVTGAGFPDWGYHGYWADDFKSVDPRFGTEGELKQLVDEAHARGMRVLLDVVYNHAGYNSRYLKDPATKGWLRNNERGDCGQDDITSCLAGLPDFKTELPEVRDYLLDAHLGLAKRVGLDGFRLDTVKHVTHDFWQEHRRRTREELGDDFFLVGEVWG